ncbi:MAG: ankyrin repeat domain-containing protein [Candidatus Babeliales bacterium]
MDKKFLKIFLLISLFTCNQSIHSKIIISKDTLPLVSAFMAIPFALFAYNSTDYNTKRSYLSVSCGLVSLGYLVTGHNLIKDYESLLHMCAAKGYSTLTSMLCRSFYKNNINIKNSQNETPLEIAIKNNHEKIVEIFLKNGADPNVKNNDGNAPLHNALINGQQGIVKLLLKNGANPNLKNNYGKTPLNFAKNLESFRILLESGADPNLPDNNLLCMRNNLKIVQLLLKYNADPNKTVYDNPNFFSYPETPLSYCHITIEIAKELLDHGADPDGGWGKSVYLPHTHPSPQVIELLLHYGADPNKIVDRHNHRPLHNVAARHKYGYETCRLLIKNRADILALDKYNNTPLHHIVANKKIENYPEERLKIASYLLAHAPQAIQMKNNKGKTPIDLATTHEMRELLINKTILPEVCKDIINDHFGKKNTVLGLQNRQLGIK